MDVDKDDKLSYLDVCTSLKKYFGGSNMIYRQIWDRAVGEAEEYLSEKDLRIFLDKYPEYALLYEIATLNPADGN